MHSKFGLKKALVYEDKDIIVVNKPAGLLTIADDKGSPNLYSYLYAYVAAKRDRMQRLFIVHRLDRETSGLLIFAKNVKTKYALQDLFVAGKVERQYEAMAHGAKLTVGQTRRIVVYLQQDEKHNIHLVKKGQGKECVTIVTCRAIKGDQSYLDIEILTGRRQQIRISLAAIDMPLVGDEKYRGPRAVRLFLNARVLAFPTGVLAQNKFVLPRLFAPRFPDFSGEEKRS